MEPYRLTVRGVDPELVRQARILAIKLDMAQGDVINVALRLVLKIGPEQVRLLAAEA